MVAVSVSRQLLEPHGVIGPTDRVKKRRDEYLAATPTLCAERSHLFTEYWKQSEGEPVALRSAKAFRSVLNEMPIGIREGELIVGSQTQYVRGCSVFPEYSTDEIAKELQECRTYMSGDAVVSTIADGDRKTILNDCSYWAGKSVWDQARALYREMWGARVEDAVQARIWYEAISSPRAAVAPDYAKVLAIGLSGVMQEARERLDRLRVTTQEHLGSRYFLQGAIIACESVICFARRHAQLARKLANEEADPIRRRELERIAQTCDWVPANPARDFYEALQGLWFVHLAHWIQAGAPGYSPGIFDQYMYPLYKQDIERDAMTVGEAAELLGCLWVKFSEIEVWRRDSARKVTQGSRLQNIAIAGQTRDGRDATNELSYLLLEVTRQLRLPQPTISVRYHDGLSEQFLLKAAEVNRDYGGGMPAWFNAKSAIVVLGRHGVPLEEAMANWCLIGCVERSVQASSVALVGPGHISCGKALELALNNGTDPRTKKQLGPQTGDAGRFSRFEELYEAFKQQLDYIVETVTNATNVGLAVNTDIIQIPFTSALQNDCIKKGKDILEGGSRYPGHLHVLPKDYQNVANALCAVRKVVFEDNSVTMPELLGALAANFEGKESLRQKLLAAPKYGNDDDYADEMMRRLWKDTDEMISRRTNLWGAPYVPIRQGLTSHYYFGQAIGALPDGRKAGEPTADGSLSPFRGTDENGPTAVINSAVKVDTLWGLSTLMNMKFHPSALQGRDALRKLLALIKTYFDGYGHHVQFNILSKETLLDAKKHPENYRDLLVRVVGFSAYFVELATDVQDEIIARTEHSL